MERGRFDPGILGRVCLLFLIGVCPLWAGAPAPTVYLRVLIQTNQIADSDQTVAVRLPDSGEVIYVNALPMASEKDLVSVDPYRGPEGETGAMLHFTHHAAISLNAETMQNQGRILVVILNGRVVYCPMVDSVIEGSDLLLPRGVTPQELAMLQAVAQANKKQQPH